MIGYTLDGRSKKLRGLGLAGQHVYWYRLGARLGDYMGSYNLGQCYYSGRGVRRNYRLAVFWWKNAAAAGYAKALTCLGAAYYNGQGVRRDSKQALKYYGLAAIGGDKIAKRMLVRLRW
jgi:TPR repeat protein